MSNAVDGAGAGAGIGGSSGSGPVQLQVEITGIANSVFRLGINTLMRVSDARIDAGTFCIASKVCEAIECTEKGLKRFNDAVTNAPVMESFQKFIWFGFGIKSPIHILRATDGGSKFAALSACLAEAYSRDAAGRIMHSFLRKLVSEGSDIPMPSLEQVSIMASKCAGVFALGEFPTKAEKMMSFDRETIIGQHTWPHDKKTTRITRGIASLEDVAGALHKIMKLKRGEYSHLTFIGVADAALVAAIGEWLMELKVVLYSSEGDDENNYFYRNYTDGEPQLTVIHSRSHGNGTLVHTETTMRIPDTTMLFRTHPESNPDINNAIGGRLKWKNALTIAFREKFTSLQHMPQDFGKALGSAARIFQAFAEADPAIKDLALLRECQYYFPASYGEDFIHFAQSRFPELNDDDTSREDGEEVNDDEPMEYKPLTRAMMCAARLDTFEEAEREFEVAIENIARFCRCSICHPEDHEPGPPLDVRISRRLTFPNCMVHITAFIIRVIRRLAGIDILPGQTLSRIGFEYALRASRDWTYRVRSPTAQRKALREKTRPSGPLDLILEGSIKQLKEKETSLLRFAEVVFGGRKTLLDPEDPGVTAVSTNGVCLFYDILRQPLQDDPSNLCRVKVIPGEIGVGTQTFSFIQEKSTARSSIGLRYARPAKTCAPKKVLDNVTECYGVELQLLVTESIGKDRQPALEAIYGIKKGNDLNEMIRIRPSLVVTNVIRGSGQVSCYNNGCVQSRGYAEALIPVVSQEGFETACQMNLGGRQVTLFRDHLVARLFIATECWEPYIIRDECLPCALLAGWKHGYETFVVIHQGMQRLQLVDGHELDSDKELDPDLSACH
ncbi:hypothetical protein N7540_000900 [Penicillium herquei]|nr:hypothetical protein N7540_000900 [Penicillium herquei]